MCYAEWMAGAVETKHFARVRLRKRKRCAPFCFPGLPAWARFVSRPDKEVGMQKAHLRRWEKRNFKIENLKFQMKANVDKSVVET